MYCQLIVMAFMALIRARILPPYRRLQLQFVYRRLRGGKMPKAVIPSPSPLKNFSCDNPDVWEAIDFPSHVNVSDASKAVAVPASWPSSPLPQTFCLFW